MLSSFTRARVSAASDVPLRDNLEVSVRRSVGGFRCCATPPPLVQARAYSPTAYYTSRFLRSLLARPLNAAPRRRRWRRRHVYKTSRVAAEMPLVVFYSLALSNPLILSFPLSLSLHEIVRISACILAAFGELFRVAQFMIYVRHVCITLASRGKMAIVGFSAFVSSPLISHRYSFHAYSFIANLISKPSYDQRRVLF